MPDYVVLDYESSGLDMYNPSFQVKSLALAWFDGGVVKYWFSTSKDAIEVTLQRLADLQTPVIVHNVAFDWSVTKCKVPGVKLNWYADTMRMVQQWDNGGKSGEHGEYDLESCCGRILPERFWAHKERAYEWIRNNVFTTITKEYKRKQAVIINKPIKRGQEGRYLDRLPPEVLEDYNKADVEVTLHLYKTLVDRFASMQFDWRIDHELFIQVTEKIIDAKIRGVKVDREGVLSSLVEFKKQQVQLNHDFRELYKEQIEQIEVENKQPFKLNSTKNLKELFVDKLGITPTILTKPSKKGTGGGRPSFSKKHLGQWGEKAAILKTKGSLQQVIGASNGLLELVDGSFDGRWHCDLKTVGTRTGRFAGAGGLNMQGLSRRNKLFMQNLKAEDGNVFISSDLAAGEPTCTSHYSKDYNYRMAVLDMVGKEPFYKDGILYCDDIYLMTASVSPMHKELMEELWVKKWPAGTFAQQWVVDSDVIKSSIKNQRALIKMLVLGLSYGMGVNKLQQTALENGFNLTRQQCKQFHKTYWQLFIGVKAFSDLCTKTVERDGCIINEFGYRNVPQPHKGFNSLIQSTVSGLMLLYTNLLFQECPWAEFVTIIHDEIIYQIPEDKVKETQKCSEKTIKELNSVLDWSVPVRIGFAVGSNLYEAK